MISEINSFTAYLQEVKHTAKNTEVSYHRDLLQMAGFMEEMGITQVEKVTKTSLNSYILYLEKEGKAAATISRELASIKAFFSYLVKERKINRDPAEFLRAPKIERKIPVILTIEEIHAFWHSREIQQRKNCGIRPCWNYYMQQGSGYQN